MARRDQNPVDPYASQNFLLQIDSITVAGFSECTGLNAETNIIEYRNGNDQGVFPRKLPGLSKFGNVTLKTGLTKDTSLLDWHKQVTDGNITRQQVSIVVQDEQHREVVRYNVANAWPSKYMAPDLKANANEIAIEAIEIAHEGVTRA